MGLGPCLSITMRLLFLFALLSLALSSPRPEELQRWRPAARRDLEQYKLRLPKVLKGNSRPTPPKAPVSFEFRKGTKSFDEVCGQENPDGIDDRALRIVGPVVVASFQTSGSLLQPTVLIQPHYLM